MTTTPADLADYADLGEAELLDQVDVAPPASAGGRGAAAPVWSRSSPANTAKRTVDPAQARLPGRERAVRLGGEGTPLVAEFAPAVLAARMGLSAYAGGRLVADVLDLDHRLPQLWAGVQAVAGQRGACPPRGPQDPPPHRRRGRLRRRPGRTLRGRAGLLDPVRDPGRGRHHRRRPRRRGRSGRSCRAGVLRQGHPVHRARHARVLRPRRLRHHRPHRCHCRLPRPSTAGDGRHLESGCPSDQGGADHGQPHPGREDPAGLRRLATPTRPHRRPPTDSDTGATAADAGAVRPRRRGGAAR